MSELGDLLELLHGAAHRWKTVRLIVRRWGHREVAGRAMRRAAEQRRAQGAGMVVTARGSGGGEPTWEMVTRAWIDRTADRSRSESAGPHGESLDVRRGSLWWSYTPHTGSISNESDRDVHGGGTNELDALLDPSALLPGFDFRVIGPTEAAGRPAVGAVAVPRTEDPHFGVGGDLGYGADEVVLVVDGERGIILRAEARLHGRPFAVFEVIEIAFDEAFDDDVFRFVSPDGSPVRPRDALLRPEPVSIEEAARRSSFTVLVPTRLPRG